jgi:murein DD-endopeptidase MepM/ murein hydrolase activator NlpD
MLTNCMRRTRTSPWAFLLVVVALLALTPVAASAQSQDEVDRTEAAKQEAYEALKDVNTRLEAALTEYQTINSELEALTWKTTQLRKRVQSYEVDVKDLRDRARELIVEEYMSGGGDLIEVALESESIQEILTRKLLLDRAADQDFVSISRLDSVRREMDRLKAQLDVDLDRVAELRVAAEVAVQNLDAVQREAAAVFAKAKAEAADALKEFQEAERLRKLREEAEKNGGSDGIPDEVTPGFQCPVPGSHFLNDWGVPRPGGRRHQGNDMFAPRGSKNVAVADGVVSLGTNTLGGITVWLRADHGVSYYYAHLEGYASGLRSGQRVEGGQTVGYVGNTGNAVGLATHTHFEIHPGGGRAVNPYFTLVKHC